MKAENLLSWPEESALNNDQSQIILRISHSHYIFI